MPGLGGPALRWWSSGQRCARWVFAGAAAAAVSRFRKILRTVEIYGLFLVFPRGQTEDGNPRLLG